MNQKTVSNSVLKIKAIKSGSDIPDLEFLKSTSQETSIKSLDQAVHNILLGMDLVSELENAYGQIESILSQVKEWVSPGLASNLEDSEKATLEVKVALKLRELDRSTETFEHKGQKTLDGSLSASFKPEEHSYLIVGTNGSPQNRINLNTCLNIPCINSKSLGLGSLSIQSPKSGLKALMILENAMAIITRMKQRSSALETHLQEIQRRLDTAIENHHAANSAPTSYEQAQEFLHAASDFIKKQRREV